MNLVFGIHLFIQFIRKTAWGLKIKLSPFEQQQFVFIKLYNQNNQLGPIKSTKETMRPVTQFQTLKYETQRS